MTTYSFTKDGKTYYTHATTRFEAQSKLEWMFNTSLSGATFKEVFKRRVLNAGVVR